MLPVVDKVKVVVTVISDGSFGLAQSMFATQHNTKGNGIPVSCLHHISICKDASVYVYMCTDRRLQIDKADKEINYYKKPFHIRLF